MKQIIAIICLVLFAGCGSRTERVSEDRMQTEGATSQKDGRNPQVQFYVRPLVAQAGSRAWQTSSVWSQNDYIDSIKIVIAGGEGSVIREATLELSGRVAAEGDAPPTPRQPSVSAVQWRTLNHIRVDSLPLELNGRRLMIVRPSVFWRDYRARVGQGMVVDSLHVTVHMAEGSRIAGGLALLWD